MGGSNPLAFPEADRAPYAVSVLFLAFMAIMVLWEMTVGFLAWVLEAWVHLKKTLLERLKEELLALGVVSLVVAFITPYLNKVCVDPAGGEVAVKAEKEDEHCRDGQVSLFPSTVIASSHFLLFWIAVVQIMFTLLSALFTSLKYRRVAIWEQLARVNLVKPASQQSLIDTGAQESDWGHTKQSIATQHTPAGKEDAVHVHLPEVKGYEPDSPRTKVLALAKQATGHADGLLTRAARLRRTLHAWVFGSMNRKVYAVLRGFLLLRVQAWPDGHQLRTINLAIASEQLIQKEISRVHAHTWVQVIFISLLLLYSAQLHQVVWATGVCLVTLCVLSSKLQYITSMAVNLIELQTDQFGELVSQPHPLATQPSTQPSGPRQQTSLSGGGSDGRFVVSASAFTATPASPDDAEAADTGATAKGSAPKLGLLRQDAGRVASKPRRLSTSGPGAGEVAVSVNQPAAANAWLLDRTMTLQRQPNALLLIMQLEDIMSGLYWFGSARFMLWILELVIVCNASVITLGLYFTTSHGISTDSDLLGLYVLAILANLGMGFYIGWVIIPQMAILYTALIIHPAEVLHHLEWSRVLNEEEEKGVAGLTYEGLEHLHSHHHADPHDPPAHHHYAHGHGALQSPERKAQSLLMDAWVVALASRAGVVLAEHHVLAAQVCISQHAPLYLSLVSVWRTKALVAQGKELPPSTGYEVKGGSWLQAFEDVFNQLDKDKSGLISPEEVQRHMHKAFHVSVTTTELQSMMYEVGAFTGQLPERYQLVKLEGLEAGLPQAGSAAQHTGALEGAVATEPAGATSEQQGVSLHTFVVFGAFVFLDSARKGVLDLHSLRSVLSNQGVSVPDWELDLMINLASPSGARRVGSVHFLQLLQDVRLVV